MMISTGITRATVIRKKTAPATLCVRWLRRLSVVAVNMGYFFVNMGYFFRMPRTTTSAVRLMMNVTRNRKMPRVKSAP